MESIERLKYPIGKYNPPENIDNDKVRGWIQEINELPSQLIPLVVDLSDEQLLFTYRPDGWNIRQLIHHIGDSHMSSYVRFKWALTEDNPLIKAYYEERWAELEDSTRAPINMSLDFIQALHKKWVFLLRSMDENQLERSFEHPESGRTIQLKWNVGLYAWHGNHHLAHIKLALENG